MNSDTLAKLAASMKTRKPGSIYTITDSKGNKVGVIDGRRLRRKEIADAIKAWRAEGYKVSK